MRHDPDGRPERDHRHLGAKHRAEGERADRSQHDAWDEDGDVGATLNPSSGRWPPSPGKNVRARITSSAPSDGQSEHEEPGRRRVPEGGGDLMPQPVFESVDQAKEEGRGRALPGSR